MSAEAYMRPAQIAAEFGVPKSLVYTACRRGPGENPLPHLESGASRPSIAIRPSAFEAWLAAEEERNAGRAS